MHWTSVSDGAVWRTECWMLSLRRLMGTLSPGLLSHPPPASCLERRMTTTCCGGKLELVSALFRSFWTRFIVHSLIVELCSWGCSADGLVSSSLASGKLTICLSSEPARGQLRHFTSPVTLRGLDNVYQDSQKCKIDSLSVQTGTVHFSLNLFKVTFIGVSCSCSKPSGKHKSVPKIAFILMDHECF